MAIDPICGMTVDEATDRSAEHDGQTVYFCSEHCRQKFLGSESKEKPNAPHDHKGHGHGLRPKSRRSSVPPDAEEDDSELRSMTLRFWVSAALTAPVLTVSMLPMISVPVDQWLGSTLFLWLPTLAQYAGGALGRLAVFRAGMAVGRHPQVAGH